MKSHSADSRGSRSPSRIVFRSKPLTMSLAIAVAAFTNSALAATSTWTGATDASWGTSGNWDPMAPTTLATVLFGPASIANLGTTLSSDTSIAGLIVTSPSGATSISTNRLTLGKSGIDMSAATQNLTISSGLTLLASAGQTWNVASGQALTLDTGAFTRGAGSTLNLQGAGTVTTTMTGLSNTNGIIGGWATVGSGTSLSFATINGSNQIVAYTGATASTNGGQSATSATTNYNISGSGTFSGGRTGNSWRFIDAVAQTSAISNRSIVTNALINAGGGTWSFTGTGPISIGTGIGVNLELLIGTNTQNINIGAPIVNNNFGGATASSVTFSSGGGQLTLTNAGNTYTGTTTVSSGTLLLSGSGALTGTTAINISGTGTMRLAAANKINNLAAFNLSGGTFNTGGVSETVGVLTLLSGVTSTFDMGTGASIFNFADSSAATWSGTLSILNWSGLATGGGTDRLFFGNSASGLTVGQIASVSFFNPAGLASGTYGATLLPTGELVAVPEPSQYGIAFAGLLFVMIASRGRRVRMAREDTLSS